MPFADLTFRHPFRKYQQMVLDLVERQLSDPNQNHQYHIVAPPGSGKTIVGLELIRRLGRPAVVFAPTTTIQRQWQEKLTLFTPDPAWIDTHSSLNPQKLADITILTYQGLSTPGENLAFVEQIALERWEEELLKNGKVETPAEARERITALREANPTAFRKEVSRRYRRIKRELLWSGKFDGRPFLHPNARDLIDRLVAQNTGTIILDECHHLLDYWAFILKTLIQALPNVNIVGLTATLPSTENEQEYENYHQLLGDVDFEIPTPAVVKEGDLAPYRDLVYFCEPTPREQDYLKNIQTHFETAVQKITETPIFQTWLQQRLGLLPLPQSTAPHDPIAAFETALNQSPVFCVAGTRYMLAHNRLLPPGLPLIEEMYEPLAVDDWLTLLETFGLEVLKISADPNLHALYHELHDVLLTFGITLSESGIRHGRSPGDLVLALSEAKDAAVIDILQAEIDVLGPALRAAVITDYEQLSAANRRLNDVLNPDAGSAARVFRQLIAAPVGEKLGPILVTGNVVLIDARRRVDLEPAIADWLAQRQADCSWRWEPTDTPAILRLNGSGPDWNSRTYVAMVTDFLGKGLTRCLIGTRAIFGEGWDAVTLNTLIDLTAITTSTGVQQLRGRTLRLDSAWPRKVAHNWDVVCISRQFDKGNGDLKRFTARHNRTWGIIIPTTPTIELPKTLTQAMANLPSVPTLDGQVVRGIAHIDLNLNDELAFKNFKKIDFHRYTQRMLNAVGSRDKVYDLWAVGAPYSNFRYSATLLVPEDLKFRTAYTITESLRMMAWRIFFSLIVGTLALFMQIMAFTPFGCTGLPILFAVAALATLIYNARDIYHLYKRTFLELPADAVLLDVGRALLAALRDAGVVSRNLNDNYVRVVETPDGSLEVFVDYASPEDAATFAEAYRQVMGPLGDVRYIIERDTTTFRNPLYQQIWRMVRHFAGLNEDLRAYHRVPDILAGRKERAEALGRHWEHYVGGSRLIYTRTEEGRRILLQARTQQRKRIRQIAFEHWR